MYETFDVDDLIENGEPAYKSPLKNREKDCINLMRLRQRQVFKNLHEKFHALKCFQRGIIGFYWRKYEKWVVDIKQTRKKETQSPKRKQVEDKKLSLQPHG